MRTTGLTILALAVLVSTATAAPDESTAEGAFYRAYYAEVALRDFAEAAKAYGHAHGRAEAEKRSDLAARALAGRARCYKALGRVEEAVRDLRAALEKDPEVENGRVLLDDLESRAGDPGHRDRLRGLVEQLGDQRHEPRSRVRQDLLLAGAAAVPYVEEGLRSGNALIATTCAGILRTLGTDRSVGALARAVADPEVRHKAAILRGSVPASPAGIRVLESALDSEDPALRLTVVKVLGLLARPLADQEETARLLRALVARIASDEISGVRQALLDRSWPDCAVPPLVPLVRELLDCEVRTLRERALSRIAGSPGLRRALADDVLRLVAEDPSATIRRSALKVLSDKSAPSELRAKAILRGLKDSDDQVARTAADLAQRDEAVAGSGDPKVVEAILFLARRTVSSPESAQALWSRAIGLLTKIPEKQIHERASDLLSLVALASRPESRPGGRRGSLLSIVLGMFRNVGPKLEDGDRFATLVFRQLSDPRDQALWLWKLNATSWAPRQTLLEAANHPDPGVRREAYATLVRFPGKGRSLPDLTHIERDLRDEGRYHASEGGFSQSSGESLATVALKLLAAHPDPRDADRLRARWNETEGLPHFLARKALVATIGREALPEVVADVADPRYADQARHQLRELIDAEAAPEFVKAAIERKSAIGALTGTWIYRQGRPIWKTKVSSEFVDRFLAELPDELVSVNLIKLTAATASPEMRRKLLLAGLRSKDPKTVEVAAERAGAFNLVEAWPLLVAALDGPHVEVRRAAKAALEEIRAYRDLKTAYERFGRDDRAEAIAKAKALLADPDPVKRRGAAFALGALGDPSGVPALLKLLGDAEESVREAALSALERLGGRKD